MWIESHQELADHPKTWRLADQLDLNLPQSVGHLHLLWWWAADYAAETGDLNPYTDREIARAAKWDGEPGAFVAALVEARWLDPDRTLHDWEQHAGRLIAFRKKDAERKREARSKESPPPSAGRPADIPSPSTVTVPNQTVPNQTGTTFAPVKPTQHPHHPIYLALCSACDIDPAEQTDDAKRAGGIAAAKIHKAGGTPEQVAERAANYPLHFGDAAMTPNALARNWAQLARAPNGRMKAGPGSRSLELARRLEEA